LPLGGSSQNPENIKEACVPGGAFLAARRFLADYPEFMKIYAKWKGTHHSSHGIISKQ